VISVGNESVSLESEVDFPGEGGEQKSSLAPGGVDFAPVDRRTRQTSQPEVVDGAEVAAVPDVKRGVEHVRLLQLFKLAPTKYLFISYYWNLFIVKEETQSFCFP